MTTRQVEPCEEDLDRATLARIDYSDAFLVTTPSEERRDGESWARSMLEGAPLPTRVKLLAGWTSLGLRLRAPGTAGTVLGWPICHCDPDHLLLAADSLLGLHGQLLFRPLPNGVAFATLVQLDNALARRVWARIIPAHQEIVASLLRRVDEPETAAGAGRPTEAPATGSGDVERRG